MCEIELVICIKTDLVLNNAQKLIYHKPQTTSKMDLTYNAKLPEKARRPHGMKWLHFKIVVCEFELQSYYYIHFRTDTIYRGMNP